MKKIATLAFTAMVAFGAAAADKVIYQNGTVFGGADLFGWWNANFNLAAENPSGEGKVFSFTSADGTTGGSMGILNNASDWKCGILNTATLCFDWYTTATGKYTIRLTDTAGTEENYVITVTDSDLNKWNTVEVSVANAFPAVANGWKEFKGDGQGYVFSVVQENTPNGSYIYFNNIIYKNIDESWVAPEVEKLPAPTTVPVPEQAASDVFSLLSGKYTAGVAFNFANWGSPTKYEVITIDNAPVAYVKNFTYFGWELANHVDLSAYDTMHVDYYTPNGSTFGFTPISPGHEKVIVTNVNVNEWKNIDIALSEFTDVDFADIFQVKFDKGESTEGYIANVYFYKKQGGDQPVNPGVPTETKVYENTVTSQYVQTLNGEEKTYPYTLKYTITYNTDKTLTVKAVYDWTNGEPVGLVLGSVFINNELNNFTEENGVRTLTTTKTYEEGENLNLQFYLPVANGVSSETVEYKVGSVSGITGIETVESAQDATVEYYNLNGVKVVNPEKGMYIRRQGNKAEKVIL